MVQPINLGESTGNLGGIGNRKISISIICLVSCLIFATLFNPHNNAVSLRFLFLTI